MCESRRLRHSSVETPQMNRPGSAEHSILRIGLVHLRRINRGLSEAVGPQVRWCRITNNDFGKIAMLLIKQDVRFVRRYDRGDPQDCGLAAIVPVIANDTAFGVISF